MKFSKSQEKAIIWSIKKLNELNPVTDNMFKKYESVKFKGGLAILIGFYVMLGVFLENPDIKGSVGALGIGVSPFLFIGGIAWILDARKKYHKAITACTQHEKSLLDMGLWYSPADRYNKEPRLIVIDTREELQLKLLTDNENIYQTI